MRGLFLALALAIIAPIGIGVASCASFQAVQPTTVREALAETEIAFIGVLQVATEGVQNGLISHDDAATLDAKFHAVAGYIDTARTLLAAHDEPGANRQLALAHAIITALSVELVNRAQAAHDAPPVTAPPTYVPSSYPGLHGEYDT